MDLKQKIKFIIYSSYKYTSNSKKYDSKETKEFFDEELIKALSSGSFNNSNNDLLSYFDFSEFFVGNQISEINIRLLQFLFNRRVEGIDKLLEDVSYETKAKLFYQAYINMNNRRDDLLSRIMFAFKNDNEKNMFFNFMVDKLNDNEIIYLIDECWYKKSSFTKILMQNERVKDIAINRINSPFFYEMVEELGLDESMLQRRTDTLKEIINNYEEYEPSDVKEAFAEYYFHDTANNSYLNIKTIIEFANSDDVVKGYVGELYNTMTNLIEFFNNKNELTDKDISLLNSPININYGVLPKLFLLCQLYFKKLMENEIQKDVCNGITPRVVKSSDGKDVKIYDIENQTENQRHVTMLISTVPLYADTAKEFKKAYYSEENGDVKYRRRSCSLLNETKLDNIFGGKNRVIFGFTDLSHRKMLMSTITDGGTDGNDIRFGKQRLTRRNYLLPIKEFIAKLQSHSEILLKMDGKEEAFKPAFILVKGVEPTQFEIDIAAEFNIPIRRINPMKYEQAPQEKMGFFEEYDYYKFTKDVPSKVEKKEMAM